MLKRDMLITLHLRIRVIATQELKLRVRLAKERALAKKTGWRRQRGRSGLRRELDAEYRDGSEISVQSPTGISWLSLSPKSARKYSRRLPSNDSGSSKMSELIIREADEEDDENDEKIQEDNEECESENEDGIGWDTVEDQLWPSMINDPGKATPLQRRWLSAMSEGKDPYISRRFEQ